MEAGLDVCSGGIMGLGETMEDRIDMVLAIRELGIASIPVNLLNAIPGTPCENSRRITQDEMRRIVAIFRFAVPHASIRLAGEEGWLAGAGEKNASSQVPMQLFPAICSQLLASPSRTT